MSDKPNKKTKTAEEKLRQELEGSTNFTLSLTTDPEKKKNLSPRSRLRRAAKSERPENIGQRIDALMNGLKVEEIPKAENVISEPQPLSEPPQPISEPPQEPEILEQQTEPEEISPEIDAPQEDILPVVEKSLDLQDAPQNEPEDISPIVDDTQEAQEVPQEIAPIIESAPESENFQEESEPETTQELSQEEITPEIEEPKAEPQEAEEIFTPETEQQEEDILPVISDETEEPQELEEPTQENLSPDEEIISPEIEEPQEISEELPDIPVIDAEEFDENQPESELPEIPIISADDENENEAEEFSTPADIIVNVDEDLPNITDEEEPEPEPEPDPEAQAVPVSVSMPESTKTAEDKLMADIAEAMTGSPLNLDTQSAEPYKLPEDFLNDSENQQQSAEDKLIANIAQAISESPLDTAQSQAAQDLEQDLNPFEDLPLQDFSQDEPEEQEEPEPQSEIEPEDEIISEPFDDVEDFPSGDEPPETEHDYEPDPEPEIEPEQEEITTDDFGDIPMSFGDDDDEEPEPESELEPEPEPEPEQQEPDPAQEPLTEQERLEQEIAAMTQEIEPENYEPDDEPQQQPEPEETYTQIQPEEETENINMPEEQTLLNNDDNIDEENNDDWDISSLGAISEAASLPDDEQEPEEPEPAAWTDEPEPEIIQEAEPEQDKEKIMGIREKLSKRKNGDSQSGKKATSQGGWLLPALLVALVAVGGLILWELQKISDRLTANIINSESFGAVSSTIESSPVYDYAIEFIIDPELPDKMAQRGRDGWQVVGSMRNRDSITGQPGYEFIFMRRRPSR